MTKTKKRLFFLSGENTSDNTKALKHLKTVCSRSKTVNFIPSQKYDSKKEFLQLKKDFKKIGFKNFLYSPLDQNFSRKDFLDSLDSSDVVFLGGGNTFYFMSYIKKRKIESALKRFSQRGGILMGLSAGAIILTPSILLAGFPREDADENEVNFLNLKGLNLVKFEICPHYRDSQSMKKDLSAYSSLYHNPIYGLKDKEFIYVEGQQIHISGKTPLFKNGDRISLV